MAYCYDYVCNLQNVDTAHVLLKKVKNLRPIHFDNPLGAIATFDSSRNCTIILCIARNSVDVRHRVKYGHWYAVVPRDHL